MKALILNSGVGKRMNSLTEETHKCLLMLHNGETILHRQLRLLGACGIKEFIITTGAHREKVIRAAEEFAGYSFTFVHSPDYAVTNYIVSMYQAREYLDDDMLILHGDLVFNRGIAEKLLHCSAPSACLYNEERQLPAKDFKGRFQELNPEPNPGRERGWKLKQVSVSIFDKDCYAFQPFYKLRRTDMHRWMAEIEQFIAAGRTTVYAEEALNQCLGELHVTGLSYKDDYIDEIDNLEDYERVAEEIRAFDYQEQRICIADKPEAAIQRTLDSYGIRKLFVVCGCSSQVWLSGFLANAAFDYVLFRGFSPNPQVDDIEKGAALFRASGCEAILVVGGGSAIDTAKGIKLLAVSDSRTAFLQNRHNYSAVRLLAVPTTGGSGSESTRFAVAYEQGEKVSVTHDSILPDDVILCSAFLKTLPDYQKKASLLDALCQAIESYWAKAANARSRAYAKDAIGMILEHYEAYLQNDETASAHIMQAANLSGKAINISRTTLPHAMSYRMTTMYGISHGHAVGLLMCAVWAALAEELEAGVWSGDVTDDVVADRMDGAASKITDGAADTLAEVMMELAHIFGCQSVSEAVEKYQDLYCFLSLGSPDIKALEVVRLAESVNPERMENHPIRYNREALGRLYTELVKW